MFSFKNKSCNHERISPSVNSGYCPDCGEYIENRWYISRCACCGIKQRSTFRKGKVSADAKFCRNCGSSSFVVEELNVIDVVNINYAVVLKQVVQSTKQSFIQTWIEENSFTPMKLLSSC